MHVPDLPTGTVTFLFTDIEGSTALLQRLGPRYADVLERHQHLIRDALASHGGIEVNTEGDAFFAVFPSAIDAVAAATTIQRRLAAEAWPADGEVRVRMGLHTGEGRVAGGDYAAIDVNRAARIAARANGGQVLLSAATTALVAHTLATDVALRDLGRLPLKDFAEPEQVHQLVIDGLRSDFPPLPKAETPTNLPSPLTSFVARELELYEVPELLHTARLVTLTGPGGTGKTRLAIELGRRVLAEFPDGVFFVRLETATDRSDVAAAIGSALGLRPAKAAGDLERRLSDDLRERHRLLILDNFEQALEAAPLIAELLDAAPQVRVLVTSRAALRLYGEQEYEVPPLGIPAGEGVAVAASPAVALFTERARAVQPSFVLTDANSVTVAAICAQLDGLPLAIELAAARIRILPPAAILTRLTDRLGMAAGGGDNLPPRQRSLRAAIGWSHDLLDESERRLFRRLSVLRGGFGLDAGRVADFGGDLGASVLDGVTSLVGKSLLRGLHIGDGEPRFAMLMTIRDYAAERLAEVGEVDPANEQLVSYLLDLLAAAEPQLLGAQQETWMASIESMHDNLRAALRWAIDSQRPEPAQRMVAAAWRFWQLSGHLAEGRDWASKALAAGGSGALVRAGALLAVAGLAYWQGDIDGTEAPTREALALFETAGQRTGVAEALYNLGFVAAARRKPREARQRFSEALELYRAHGDIHGQASALGALGYGEFMTGEADAAIGHLQEAGRLQSELGNRFRYADSRFGLGQIHRQLGRYELAEAYYREALGMTRPRDPRRATHLMVLAAIDLAQGDLSRAARLAAAAERMRHEVGGGMPTGMLEIPDVLAEARAVLAPDAFAGAMTAGAAMTDDEAIDYALGAVPQPLGGGL